MVSIEILRKLADIGFMATSGGFFAQSEIIFKAVELNRDNSIVPYIGYVLNLINMNKREEALDMLEKKALKMHPDDQVAKSLQGLTLMLLGRNNESEKCLKAVLASDDASSVNLAKNLLDQLNNCS